MPVPRPLASAKAKIKINTVDHNTFQQNITSYLQGSSDDLFTWFAGYRMQYFAAQGLAQPIDDVWEKIGGNFDKVARTLSTGLDGHHYLVPLYKHPWVAFHSRSHRRRDRCGAAAPSRHRFGRRRREGPLGLGRRRAAPRT